MMTTTSERDDNDTTAKTASYVLYVDHQGHPAPLTECFHATASRRLTSTVFRYPVSSVEEVDSGYCPQCLSFHDATTALELGYCPKPTCQRCPYCLSMAAIHLNKAEEDADKSKNNASCYYRCGLCDWRSSSNNNNSDLVVPIEDAVAPGKVELMRAADDLGKALAQRRQESAQPLEALFEHLTATATNIEDEKGTRDSERRREEQEWSVEILEAKLKEKISKNDLVGDMPDISGVEIKRISILDILAMKEKERTGTTTEDEERDMPLYSYELQATALSPSASPPRGLLPLPMPLSLRKSRRCRAELADGRPGILLKPKLNPLEGDSSLPTGHGQWHRKDSSAIHVIPRVVVAQRYRIAENDGSHDKHVFLLKVSNPTLGTVRVRLSSQSNYDGEVACWLEPGDDDTKKSQDLSNLLVDTLTQTKVHAKLQPELRTSTTSGTATTTDTAELLSAEDSIIELGSSKASETPASVLQWDPTSVSGLRLVAQSASEAWFEWEVVSRNDGSLSTDTAIAVPLALQVDLGKGSWESSLIPVNEDVDQDVVTFDLLFVF